MPPRRTPRPAPAPAAQGKVTVSTGQKRRSPVRLERGPTGATTGTRPAGGTRPVPKIVSGGKYQNIILAEFIGTLLLTVLTPVAKDNAKQGLSPYAGADMVKLAAIILLYFLLGLVSSAGPAAARLCAWLGGLVLIADGLYEASNISKDLALFTGGINSAANPTSGGSGPAGVPGTSEGTGPQPAQPPPPPGA